MFNLNTKKITNLSLGVLLNNVLMDKYEGKNMMGDGYQFNTIEKNIESLYNLLTGYYNDLIFDLDETKLDNRSIYNVTSDNKDAFVDLGYLVVFLSNQKNLVKALDVAPHKELFGLFISEGIDYNLDDSYSKLLFQIWDYSIKIRYDHA